MVSTQKSPHAFFLRRCDLQSYSWFSFRHKLFQYWSHHQNSFFTMSEHFNIPYYSQVEISHQSGKPSRHFEQGFFLPKLLLTFLTWLHLELKYRLEYKLTQCTKVRCCINRQFSVVLLPSLCRNVPLYQVINGFMDQGRKALPWEIN